MYIGTLVEDTLEKEKNFLHSAHGLSLYIKYKNKNILFDSGPSDLIIENSLKMHLDLSKIDYLVISHAHFDHGGGIIPFLENNYKAKVYIQRCSNNDFYFANSDTEKEYIGLDPRIFEMYGDRLIYTDKLLFEIDTDIFLIPDIKLVENLTINNTSMLVNDNDTGFIQDDFEHEQAMVIKDENRYYLFTGCSHKGIINIANSIKSIFNIEKIDFLIGGLHLVDDPVLRTSISNTELDKVSDYLKSNIAHTYTCHCTGDEAFNYLKDKLQNNISYLRTGSEINI